MVSGAGWQHFDHDADIGVVGSGGSVAEAFEQVALGLTAVITDQPVACDVHVTVEAEAPDPEILLVDWLNGLIYEMATRRLLFGAFAVAIRGNRLRGEAWGEPVDARRHQPAVEVKGATLTALHVRQDADGAWHAQCVLDV